MTPADGPVREHPALSPPRTAEGRTPAGYRVLRVLVPEPIFKRVKAQAYLSGMRFPEHVARLLEKARSPADHGPSPSVIGLTAREPVPATPDRP